MKRYMKYVRIILLIVLCVLMTYVSSETMAECEAHAWKDGKPATCTEPGNRICTICGAYEETSTTAHAWKDGKPASCAEAGNRICTVCGAVEETGTIDHVWKDGKPASCAEAGNRICTGCGAVEEIAALNHEWKDGKPASCKEEGNSICVQCGAVEVIPAVGHQWKEGAGYSCLKDGNRICTVCGEVEVIPATGHSYSRYTVEATTESQGYTRNTCRRCGYVYYSNYTPILQVMPEIDLESLAYGGIVTDIDNNVKEYTVEKTDDGLLTIVTKANEDGKVEVRKLHLSAELIDQFKTEGIISVHFKNGNIAVEFELSVFESAFIVNMYNDVEGSKGFVIVIDPDKMDEDALYVKFYIMRDHTNVYISKGIEDYSVFVDDVQVK